MIKLFLFCFYKIWCESMFLTGSFAVLIRAAPRRRRAGAKAAMARRRRGSGGQAPPFRIFAGLRLAEVASATQVGGTSESLAFPTWCRGRDSNSHGFPHTILSRARIPF